MPVTGKKCGLCGQVKPLTQFYRNARLRDGRRRDCKLCEKRMNRNSMLQWNFGITLADYDRMFEAQQGVCAICGKPESRCENGVVTRLAVDHDHQTGRVRGLLCRKCNAALGLAGDSVEMLSRCIAYLAKSGATV